MTHIIQSATVISIIVLAGACATATAPSNRAATMEDVEAAIGNERQRSLWAERKEAGNLPPVDAIETPSEPVTSRGSRPAMDDKRFAPSAPTIAAEQIAAIYPFDLPVLEEGYFGPVRVVAVEEETLRLADQEERPIALRYRAPSRQALASVAERDELLFESRPRRYFGPSHQYKLALSDQSRNPLLVALLEQGDEPISFSAEFSRVDIRQTSRERRYYRDRIQQGDERRGDNIDLPVEVSVNGEVVVLRNGQVLKASEWGQPFDVVVFNSSARPPEAAWSDGAPYALHIAIYAVE